MEENKNKVNNDENISESVKETNHDNRKEKVSKLLMFPGFVSGISNYNDDTYLSDDNRGGN